MHSLTGLLQLLSRSTTTIYRWVQRFTPLLADAARPCRHAVGTRWWVDETYVKVRGQWRYVYQAIDQFGQVIDVFVSPRRDTTAARRFFQHALATTQVTPTQVITDKAATYPIVLEELLPAAWHRTEPYANNHIEADHGLWVPVIGSLHATCTYAWISSPTQRLPSRRPPSDSAGQVRSPSRLSCWSSQP